MMDEVIRVQDDYYILATSRRLDDRTRVLKQGDTFAVFDRFGDMDAFGPGEFGLYHQDTRFLSRLTLKVEGIRPLLLSSSVKDDNLLLAVDSMNPDIRRGDEVTIPHGTAHVHRAKLLWNGTCHERIRVHNYGSKPVELSLSIEFATDFADIFEVRGAPRLQRGRLLPVAVRADGVVFVYEGLDDRVRRTRITFDPAPDALSESGARHEVRLSAGEERDYRYAVTCEVQGPRANTRPAVAQSYDAAAEDAAAALAVIRAEDPDVSTSNEQFNDWINRSSADLHMMRTDTPYGPYAYAGIPWFCTVFGRDGIITALECLNFNPGLARGVLAYLAARQATVESAERDAQPGKILHETRAGEMAVLGEVPFECYYGSVDATPLFVLLAGAYYERTGDAAFIRSIWPNVERALEWIDRYGDQDGDGFVEYMRQTPRGLVHQGWKDSQDAVFHADGAPAEGPIALCEVQGYVYAARLAAAALAATLGHDTRAHALAMQAHELGERFDAAFWCDDIATYALALDGAKRPCRVRTSNAGHCLFAGIARHDRAGTVAGTLTTRTSFSGWGVRTVADGEARYNPMSYHNGSIWPHDNALVATGLARYGHTEKAASILSALLDASLFFDLHRVPELFCGFPRRPGESPTRYPVACAPQTWASGAPFLLLASCLGLRVQASTRRVVFTKPFLPESIERVTVKGLRLGDARLDVLVTRHARGDVGVNVLAREGDVDVVVLK